LLKDTAYLFFHIDFECGFITREFQFGNEYRADFLIAQDRFSSGNEYIFIEMESPGEKPYTKNGNPSQMLTHALQQIRDWKRWLNGNNQATTTLFPSVLWKYGIEATMKFKIVIGRDVDFMPFEAQIVQLGRENGVEIKSYDHLLHTFDRKHYFNNFLSGSGQIEGFSKSVRNKLVSPFLTTFSSGDYGQSIRNGRYGYHLMFDYAEALAERAKFNKYLADFDELTKRKIEEYRDLIRPRNKDMADESLESLIEKLYFWYEK
jgi:hypothetical protein